MMAQSQHYDSRGQDTGYLAALTTYSFVKEVVLFCQKKRRLLLFAAPTFSLADCDQR